VDVYTHLITIEPNLTRCYSNRDISYMIFNWLFEFYRDEEYDRGKRKKVRLSQHTFGGPNLFQEIAMKKTQFKKSKVDRARSGNQPFRI
jgi:hypothetical protein